MCYTALHGGVLPKTDLRGTYDGNYRAAGIFSALYRAGHGFSPRLSRTSAMEKEVSDHCGRASGRRFIYDRGLRYFSPCVPFQKHFRRA